MKILLLIAITILAVGCGAKDEPTTETKPLEEKAVEVKEEVKPEEPVAVNQPKLEGVNIEEFKFREGIGYLKGSDTPYTGKYYGLYENGQKQVEGNVKNGKRDELVTKWYENGNKKEEENYKDGKPDGLWTQWYENGQKKRELNQKDGKRHGLNVEWYKNGKKSQEGNWKDDKLDGLWVVWHENGQKAVEANYKDGKEEGLETQWHENGQKGIEKNYKDGKLVEGSAKYWNSKGEPVDSEEEAFK